jgi:hypothetical protein
MSTHRKFTLASNACPEPGCRKLCRSAGGLKRHRESTHLRLPQQAPPAAAGPAPLNDDYGDGLGSPPPSPRNSPPPERTVPQNQRGTTTTYHPLLDGASLFFFFF